MVRLQEHSGAFVRNKGGWGSYHKWCEKMGIAKFNRHTETLDRLPKKVMVKVGRNEPCLCGSGKKFKKCCK